jgi:hypothetical protein
MASLSRTGLLPAGADEVGAIGTRLRGRVGVWETGIVLMAFLNYLGEHPATRVLADDFTDVLTHLGALAAVPMQDESALA